MPDSTSDQTVCNNLRAITALMMATYKKTCNYSCSQESVKPKKNPVSRLCSPHKC